MNNPFLSMRISIKDPNFIYYNLTKILSIAVLGIGVIVLITSFVIKLPKKLNLVTVDTN